MNSVVEKKLSFFDMSLSVSLSKPQSSPRKIAIELSAPEVQKLLREIGFEEKDVIAWNEAVEVPFGTSSKFFVVCKAIRCGLPFNYEAIYPGIRRYILETGKITDFVSTK